MCSCHPGSEQTAAQLYQCQRRRRMDTSGLGLWTQVCFRPAFSTSFFALPDEKRNSTIFILIYLCKKIAYRIRFFLAFYNTFIAWNRKYKINFFYFCCKHRPPQLACHLEPHREKEDFQILCCRRYKILLSFLYWYLIGNFMWCLLFGQSNFIRVRSHSCIIPSLNTFRLYPLYVPFRHICMRCFNKILSSFIIINRKNSPFQSYRCTCSSCRHEVVIRYLLEQGADPFVTDVEMNISLHWAAFSGSKGITDLLLSAGCNVNQTNAIGGQCAPRDSFRLLGTVIDGHTTLVGIYPDIFCVFFQCCGSGMFISRIPYLGDKKIPDTRSGTASKNLSIFNPKNCFRSSRKYDPGCSSRIPNPDLDF